VYRSYAAVDEMLAADCAHQVVVTHGFTQTFIVAAWIRMPLESVGYVSFPCTSGAITVLQQDDYFHNRAVVKLGDTTHLES
jgi:probable phosphoglycerate mutase